MKNFVFISPNFPVNYWKFCAELKNNGLRVLGIGDSPYDDLLPELRDALHEYYKVSSLENYEEVFRAVAFFTYKYGKIDWLESNNEYWLERDAKLRTEFHITSGFQEADMFKVKYKSAMKAFYDKAGIPTARYHIVDDFASTRDFANMVGYPVVVKPDNGVGASHTYRLKSDEELEYFFATKDDETYIMEEMVKGFVCTYDGIVGAEGQILFEAGNVTVLSLMDVVNDNMDSLYYIVKDLNPKVKEAGLKTVKAFDARSRFFHLEFFCLTEDQEGLARRAISSVWKSICVPPAVTPPICITLPTRRMFTKSGQIWLRLIRAPNPRVIPIFAPSSAAEMQRATRWITMPSWKSTVTA